MENALKINVFWKISTILPHSMESTRNFLPVASQLERVFKQVNYLRDGKPRSMQLWEREPDIMSQNGMAHISTIKIYLIIILNCTQTTEGSIEYQ